MELKKEQLDAYSQFCMPVDTNISLDSVILSERNRKKIVDFIVETEHKDDFIAHGLKPVNRIIMYGASGTGKTYLTKALTNYLGYTMLYVDISSALATGIAAQSLAEIFKLANEIETAVIFLDECDAICWARDDSSNRDDASIRRANNTLFQLLDQMNPKCVFVSATNLYKNLDAAFVSRFNVKMEFERPRAAEIDKGIEKFLGKGFELDKDVDSWLKEAVLQQVDKEGSFAYRNIRDWVERVEKTALVSNTLVVKESDIYNFLMQELRIEVCRYDNGEPYLHQYAKGAYS